MRFGILVLAVLVISACGPSVENEHHVAAIRKVVESTPPWVHRGALGKRLWTIQRAFYEERGYRPAWVNGDRTTPAMKELVQHLRFAETHGFDPGAYGVEEFERLREESQTRLRGTRFPVERIPELDAKLTYAYLRYAADLLAWGTNPRQVSEHWWTDPKKEDLAARLKAALDGNRIRDSLEELAPSHPQYKGLQAALLKEKRAPTGQLERILMNLERWRWAPRDLGGRYVLVNIPAYLLQVMEGDHPALSMRIIVGQPDTPTPFFSDEMTYVVFSPYWNIPENILREETLPRVLNDPDFLRRNNMEVVGTSGRSIPRRWIGPTPRSRKPFASASGRGRTMRSGW
jgi:murein L,D-transpeptidase YcbB/YkuD